MRRLRKRKQSSGHDVGCGIGKTCVQIVVVLIPVIQMCSFPAVEVLVDVVGDTIVIQSRCDRTLTTAPRDRPMLRHVRHCFSLTNAASKARSLCRAAEDCWLRDTYNRSIAKQCTSDKRVTTMLKELTTTELLIKVKCQIELLSHGFLPCG